MYYYFVNNDQIKQYIISLHLSLFLNVYFIKFKVDIIGICNVKIMIIINI